MSGGFGGIAETVAQIVEHNLAHDEVHKIQLRHQLEQVREHVAALELARHLEQLWEPAADEVDDQSLRLKPADEQVRLFPHHPGTRLSLLDELKEEEG